MSVCLSQLTQLGRIQLELSEREVAILKLLAAPEVDAVAQWEKLWRSLKCYDDLEFSCKELMPSAVRKLQSSVDPRIWSEISPHDAQRLRGLSRHTWTKNRVIVSQFQSISEILAREEIEHIAIKGIGEILAHDGELAMMRTSRDIDILIKPDDWKRCHAALGRRGWRAGPPTLFSMVSVLVRPHAETLAHADGIVELDVHHAAISGMYSNSEKFTEQMWRRKVASQGAPLCSLPSLEERFIIATANAYLRFNWQTGQIAKYILDACWISERMSADQIQVALEDGERYLKLGSKMRELLGVIDQIRSNDDRSTMSASVAHSHSAYSPPHFTVRRTFIKKLQYLEYLTEICSLLLSGVHTARTLYYLTLWIWSLVIRTVPAWIRSLIPGRTIVAANAYEQQPLTWYLSWSESSSR